MPILVARPVFASVAVSRSVSEEVSIAKHKYTTSAAESVYDNSQLCMVMKARRQAAVLDLIANEQIHSQEQLRTRLKGRGYDEIAGDSPQ